MAEAGFTKMTGAKQAGNAPEVGVGMLGYAFMGKAHSNAYKKLPYMMYPPVAFPKLIAICGRNEDAAKEAGQRDGYEGYYTDPGGADAERRSHRVVRQRRPEQRARRAVHRAGQAGKSIICEKPLACTAKRSRVYAGGRDRSGREACRRVQLSLRASRARSAKTLSMRRQAPENLSSPCY